MKKSRLKLFHNQHRQIFYSQESKTLNIYWYGKVLEEEQLKNIEFTEELIKVFDVEHIEIHTKKAKFVSLRPTRIFIEKVLTKIYHQGGQTFTIFQKPIKNQVFILNAYLNAIRSLGIDMRFRLITV